MPPPNRILAILTLVYVFNFIDRNVMNSIIELIKTDLAVSDTMMGVLTGPAFVLFYALAGLPIARWADRGPRTTILALGLTLWSAMTAACGLAQSYTQLALARVGVGIGEASGVPTSQSILTDTFPPERRYRTLSIYSLGVHFGILFGMLAGGWIGEFFGWRMAFIVVGLPGILLAVVVKLAVPEPPRGRYDPPGAGTQHADLRSAARWLLGLRSYVWLLVGAPLATLAGHAYTTWASTFFIRIHGMGVGEAGTWVGTASLIAGGSAVLVGGILSDRLSARDARWPVWIIMLCMVAELPTGAAAALSETRSAALTGYFLFIFAAAMPAGPIFGLMLNLAPPTMRATSSATYLFVGNLMGLGGGPLLVGILNDFFQASQGAEAIRSTLVAILAVSVVAIALLWLASRTLRQDLEKTQTWGAHEVAQ